MSPYSAHHPSERREPERSEAEPNPRRRNSLQHGCFYSRRIVRQTRAEFRPSNPEGSRGFESAPLRHTVWHVSLLFGEVMKPMRGARFTRRRGPGEGHRPQLTAKIAQNSLFAILACPSAIRPTSCGNHVLGKNA